MSLRIGGNAETCRAIRDENAAMRVMPMICPRWVSHCLTTFSENRQCCDSDKRIAAEDESSGGRAGHRSASAFAWMQVRAIANNKVWLHSRALPNRSELASPAIPLI
jgi:hypothetical protein